MKKDLLIGLLIGTILAIIVFAIWQWFDLRLIHYTMPLPDTAACPSGDTSHTIQLFSATRPIAYVVEIAPCFRG